MNTSESINEVAKALCDVQANLKPARFNSTNPFFKSKYADLNSVFDSCRSLMADHGLSITQFPGTAPMESGPAVSLTTRLMHESGQWLEDTMVIPLSKATAQDYGSALTYARRYAISAIIGIVADEDDDGNQAQPPDRKKAVKSAAKPTKKATVSANQQKPSAEQMKQLHAAGTAFYADKWDDQRTAIVKYVSNGRVTSSKHLTLEEWQKAIDGIKAKADAISDK